MVSQIIPSSVQSVAPLLALPSRSWVKDVKLPGRLQLFTFCTILLVIYLALVRKYRYQRVQRLLNKYDPKTGRKMTLEEAREIVRWIYVSEFPWSGEISLMLILLRVSSIGYPTV